MTSYLWRLGLAAYKMHPGIAQHITQMMIMTMLKNATSPNTAPTRMPMILSTVRQEKWLLSGGEVMKERSVIFKHARPIIMNPTYSLIIVGWLQGSQHLAENCVLHE